MKDIKFNQKEFEEYKKRHDVVSKRTKYAGIALLSLLGAGVITTAVVVPITVINSKNNDKSNPGINERDIKIDGSVQGVNCKVAYIDGGVEIRLSSSTADYDIIGVESVIINGVALNKNEYSFDSRNSTITIKKEILEKHTGSIVVKPQIQQVMDYNKYFKFINLDYENLTCTLTQKSNTIELPSPLNIPGTVKINNINYAVTILDLHGANFKEGCEVHVPSACKRLDSGCFDGAKVGKIVLSEGLEEIGASCFSNCTLESINIPHSLKKIDNSMGISFSNCTNLKTIILENDSEDLVIDKKTDDTGLFSYSKTIYIKDGLRDPKADSYIKKSGFSKIKTTDKPGYSKWIVENQFPISTDGFEEGTCGVSGTSHYDYAENETIPETIDGKTTVAINNKAFYQNNSINKLNFSTGIKTVGEDAFNSSTIKEVDFKNVETVGDGSFANTNIKKIVLPGTLKKIGDWCFQNCNQLTEINIPSSITPSVIGYNAWDGCDKLRTIYIDSADVAHSTDNCKKLLSCATTIYIKDDISDPTTGQYIVDQEFVKTASDVNGYNKWEYTKRFAFNVISAQTCSIQGYGRTPYEEDLTLPDNDGEGNTVTEIANSGFKGFKNLVSVALPSTITKINDCAFSESSVAKIILNENLTEIGESAFEYCESLEEITIPSTLNIPSGEYVWNGCNKLLTVILNNQSFVSSTSSCSGLLDPFNPWWSKLRKTIYIKDDLTEPIEGTYIYNVYNKQDTSDKPGYSKWVQKEQE